MILRISLLLIATLCFSTGCQSSPQVRATIDQMTAELTRVEDEYYELEYKYDLAKSELAACQRKSGIEPASDSTDSEIYYESADACEINCAVNDGGTSESAVSETGFTHVQQSNFAAEVVTDHVATHVVLEPRETGGFDRNADMIDDGIKLSILPQNATGQIVSDPGSIQVSLIDPLLTGQRQRVGMWKFPIEKVQQAMAGNNGIVLTLPWLEHMPENNKLKLFVRYTTAENERMETSMDILVNTAAKQVRVLQPTKPVNRPPAHTAKQNRTGHHALAKAKETIGKKKQQYATELDAPPATIYLPDQPVRTAEAEIDWKPTR